MTIFEVRNDCATVPQQWKLGEISPVYKKDCNLTKSNYRPLSILPSLSKVFERLVHARVSPYFENIYHKHVFAYRKFHGCATGLLSLTEQWRRELDNHKIISMVSVDLSKAFDTLPHDLILQKLCKYGADEATTRLISNYLSGRKQRVKLGEACSPWLLVSKGIPQGSILGPLLFNIFMNDLHQVTKHSTLSTYADDTQIFFAGNDAVDVENSVNSDLERIDKWFEQNEMKRNHSKYKAMVMGNTKSNLVFSCENTVIPIEKEVELLGVTVDSKLKFEAHVFKFSSFQVSLL